jgi:hypothetical protein
MVKVSGSVLTIVLNQLIAPSIGREYLGPRAICRLLDSIPLDSKWSVGVNPFAYPWGGDNDGCLNAVSFFWILQGKIPYL